MARIIETEKPETNPNTAPAGSLLARTQATLKRLAASPLRRKEQVVLDEIKELESKLTAARRDAQKRADDLNELRSLYSIKSSTDVPFELAMRDLLREDEPFEQLWARVDKDRLLRYLMLQTFGKHRHVALDGWAVEAGRLVQGLETALKNAQGRLAEVQRQM